MNQSYDSTQDTLTHIRQVGQFLSEAVGELCQRASQHDHSKLGPYEKEAFDRATPKLKELEYGSLGYQRSLEDIRHALAHHYAENSHHPEHYEAGIAGMDLFDLVEMIADWKAAAMRHSGSPDPNLEHNVERFGIDPQLAQILRNTLERW